MFAFFQIYTINVTKGRSWSLEAGSMKVYDYVKFFFFVLYIWMALNFEDHSYLSP